MTPSIRPQTPDEYLTEYNSRRGDEYSRFHGYTYDGIWAAALAIQYVADRKENFATGFQYRVKDWENIFLEALRNTSFEGVTGPVRFYNNERRANILLKQFQYGAEQKVAEYEAQNDRIDWTKGTPIKWNGRTPPKDRTLRIIELSQVNPTVYFILAIVSGLGICMASVFLGFNIKYRNQRYIKMSSPHLNNLIIVGCMLTYSSVIFLGLDSGLTGNTEMLPYICTARAWSLMSGFSLAFGAMFSKTWRVHSIFTDVKLNKKVIKDYQLFIVVGVLLFIDVVIMVTWQVSDPFFRDVKFIEPVTDVSAVGGSGRNGWFELNILSLKTNRVPPPWRTSSPCRRTNTASPSASPSSSASSTRTNRFCSCSARSSRGRRGTSPFRR